LESTTSNPFPAIGLMNNAHPSNLTKPNPGANQAYALYSWISLKKGFSISGIFSLTVYLNFSVSKLELIPSNCKVSDFTYSP